MLELILSLAALFLLLLPVYFFVKNCSRSAYKPAFYKALFLWLISTSPVFAGVLLARPKNKTDSVGAQFQGEIFSVFTISEVFVYTAAFLAPVLYVIFDLYKAHSDGDLKLNREELSKHLRGMQGVFLSAFAILILTLLAYSSAKSDPEGFMETYLALFLTQTGLILYFASLSIWYAVILWETSPRTNFEDEAKEETKTFSDEYAKRRGKRT